MGKKVKKQHHRTYVRLLIVLIVLCALGSLGWVLFAKVWTVVSVGGYTLNRVEYAAIVDDAKTEKVKEDQVKKDIAAHFSTLSAADDAKFDYAADVKVTEKESNKYLAMIQKTKIVDSIAMMRKVGAKKIAAVYFPFSRYAIGFLPTEAAKKMGNDASKIGNRDAILDDMNYARGLADDYRQAYIDKKMTASEIVDTVKSNDRLNYGQAFNTSFYGYVGNDLTIYDREGKQDTVLQGGVFDSLTAAPGTNDISGVLERMSAYGVPSSTPELKRGEQLIVAWYFVINEGTIKQNLKAYESFTNKKKEYESNAIVQ